MILFFYANDDRKEVIGTLHTLRQQSLKEDSDMKYLALSDFIAPRETGVKDYVGMFAVGMFGVEKLVASSEKNFDDYNVIMVKALADRLAEAFAEKLHEDIRKRYWGYSETEKLAASDLLKIKYQGIRPAPGYPSQPDHTEKSIMWDIMKIKEQTGIELTESLAMLPASSVSALCFANKKSSYFAVGQISKDQIVDYAKRKNFTVQETERWLSSNLAYDV